MKTFDQIPDGGLHKPSVDDLEEDENLVMSLYRKDSRLVFVRSSKTFGDAAPSHIQLVLGILTGRFGTTDTEVRRLTDATGTMLRDKKQT